MKRYVAKGGWQIAENWKPRGEFREPRMYVSLNGRGEIALTAQAFKAIGSPWNVTLMYDAATRCIAVKFPTSEQNFAVGAYGRDRKMKVVRARKLLIQFGIKVERTLVFRDIREVHGREPIQVLDLNSAEELPPRAILARG